MPRKKFVPTEEQRNLVKTHVCVGTPQERIVKFIIDSNTGRHISVDTLSKYFKEELENALAEANAAVAETLFAMATSGEQPGMTAFWMKCKARWHEVQVVQSQQLNKDGMPIDPVSSSHLDQIMSLLKTTIDAHDAASLYTEIVTRSAEPVKH